MIIIFINPGDTRSIRTQIAKEHASFKDDTTRKNVFFVIIFPSMDISYLENF